MVVNLINILNFLYKNFFQSLVIIGFKAYNKFILRKHVPKINNPILLKSATELVDDIKKRKIRSETIVRLYINRIKEIQPILNCVVDERFDDAIKDSHEIEKILDSNENLDKYPLLGIPFTCKELIGVKGMQFSSGLVCRKHLKAEEDADVIKNMKNAGAILLCTTNISELGLYYESSNYVHGQTNNPYDTRRTVGGSSGGEACIIASCGSIIGIGSDIAGSIRIPSFFNGIYGHKPTNGLLSNKGQHPTNLKETTNFMLTSGPMCRYSIDLSLVLGVLLAENKSKLVQFENFDLRTINFYYVNNLNLPFVSKISKDILVAQNKLIQFIERFTNQNVKLLNSKILKDSFYMWLSMASKNNDKSQVSKLMADDKYEKNVWLELIKAVFYKSDHTAPVIALSIIEKLPLTDKEIDQYLDLLQNLKIELDSILKTNGVLIFPSFPCAAPFHNQALWTHTIDHIFYFGIFNALGFPSTQIPLGLNSEKLPIGVQLISNCFCDNLLIKLSNIIEKELGGWVF